MLLQGDMNASLSEDIYNYETFLQPYNKSGTEYTLAGRNVDWIKSLFTSVGMPSVLSTTYDTYYLSCMQTDDLVRALEDAYKALCATAHVQRPGE